MTHEAVEPKTEAEKKIFYGDVKMELLGMLRRNPYIVRDNLILDDELDAIRETRFLEKHGVDLIVDLTAIGLGRDMKKLGQIARNMDIDVAIGTGFFVHDSLDAKSSALTCDEMAEFMVNEIENGIENTGVRAGVIGEVGVSEKIYPVERESLLAAAKAHRRTGLPVYVHTYPWTHAGFTAAKLLTEHGVAPESICVCHTDVTFDYEYMRMLLKLGVYLEFDNFGKEFYFEAQDGAFAGGPFETDIARVRMLKRLIADGYGAKLLIASDLCLKASLHKYGGWGYDHIFENIVPMMRREGLGAEDIRCIVGQNPMRYLMQE